MSMSVYIQNIECYVPENFYAQSLIMEKMKNWLKGSKKINRYIDAIYKESSIGKRHSIISNSDNFFSVSDKEEVSVPTTGVRNQLFMQAAKEMFVSIAQKVIDGCDNVSFSDITHVITVSCTGFFNPGPDYEIIEKLNLNRNVQRYNIGFMGCHAAFPALRLANAICQADSNATVLVAAVELCSLHVQLKDDLNSILSGAIFADGGGGVLISSKPPTPGQTVFELKHFESAIIPNSRDEMTWTIGDNGFEMVLSQNVPKIIESNIRQILMPILHSQEIALSDIDHWAIHPGGRAILDKIESSLNLTNRFQVSRAVLRQYGNMSSATILFVLKRILQEQSTKSDESVLAMAFGPGLTVEVATLTKLAAEVTGRPLTESISVPAVSIEAPIY